MSLLGVSFIGGSIVQLPTYSITQEVSASCVCYLKREVSRYTVAMQSRRKLRPAKKNLSPWVKVHSGPYKLPTYIPVDTSYTVEPLTMDTLNKGDFV